jgi:hypothetical protein
VKTSDGVVRSMQLSSSETLSSLSERLKAEEGVDVVSVSFPDGTCAGAE